MPAGARGERRLRAENQFLELFQETQLPLHIFRLPGTALVGAIGAVTATMPRPLRWKCMVVAGFLLSIASNFGVATYLLDERLSFIRNEMFPFHLSALGSLALTLLCVRASSLVGEKGEGCD